MGPSLEHADHMAGNENFNLTSGDGLDAMLHSPFGQGIANLLMGPAMFSGAGRPEASSSIMQSIVSTALSAENTAAIFNSVNNSTA
jgi:hypothetical protein